VLPSFSKDTTDRNRTSPFAFTGNKFEFRMLGSSFSVSGPNIVMNTIVAKSLKEFRKSLEGAEDIEAAVLDLVRDTYNEHRRIVFNGNNYAPEWVKEAEGRGLLNLRSTPEALDAFVDQKNIDLFSEFGVFSPLEMHSRFEILTDEYSKTIRIEALTMRDMIVQEIIPAVSYYTSILAQTINAKRTANPAIQCRAENATFEKVSGLMDSLAEKCEVLSSLIDKTASYSGSGLSHFTRQCIVPAMEDARKVADELELLVARPYWPFPTYGDILHYVD